MTGLGAVTYVDAPDIAIGDVLGSSVFNIFILAILDAFYHPVPISSKAHHGHIISASFGVIIFSITITSIIFKEYVPSFAWIGIYSIVFIILYLIAIRLVYFYEKRQISKFIKEISIELKYENISTHSAVTKYAINAIIIILAAVLLPKIGKDIAESSKLGQTFVGNVFIALSTSLPELVVSISAIKMGAVDLAIGNIFGSNLFNMFILAIDDIFFLRGPILSSANLHHIISATSSIIMTCIAIIGLTYRQENKSLLLSWDSIMIVLMYMINVILLYWLT